MITDLWRIIVGIVRLFVPHANTSDTVSEECRQHWARADWRNWR